MAGVINSLNYPLGNPQTNPTSPGAANDAWRDWGETNAGADYYEQVYTQDPEASNKDTSCDPQEPDRHLPDHPYFYPDISSYYDAVLESALYKSLIDMDKSTSTGFSGNLPEPIVTIEWVENTDDE